MKTELKTHRLRLTKDKQTQIITFTPKFLELLKTAKHDMVIRVLLNYLTKKVESLTGKKSVVCNEQYIELTEFVKTIDTPTGSYVHLRAQTWLIDGIMNSSTSLVDLFKLLNEILPRMQDSLEAVEI